jgi:UDP-glucose 4-epimerase
MTTLVTGGAGYIGSHMVHALVERGENVVVLDDLSTGTRKLVSPKADFVQGGVENAPLVRDLIAQHRVSAVIHFAGSIVAPESVTKPLLYYANNVAGSCSLLQSCVESGIKHFIFSSTAAVYGEPGQNAVAETAPRNPINPYGKSKLMTERMLEDTAHAHDFSYVALRYFNVAGADPQGRTGQASANPTHLIRRACWAALGRIPHLDILGTDYPTPDGTGVRDYVHVTDLVKAHALALDYLREGGKSDVFNCGYGEGYSVRQIVEAVGSVAGKPLIVREGPRRPGDPPSLCADPSKLKSTLGWKPELDDLEKIVSTALAWEKKLQRLTL